MIVSKRTKPGSELAAKTIWTMVRLATPTTPARLCSAFAVAIAVFTFACLSVRGLYHRAAENYVSLVSRRGQHAVAWVAMTPVVCSQANLCV